jgi:monofunctional biosynthetic peptidoglycan transglycosylase
MRLDLAGIEWQIINDGVMGGLSRSAWRLDGSGLHFQGTLSTANGGGFASIRGALPTPLTGFSAIGLTVSGDGRQYQLRLRETGAADGVAWRACFDAPGIRQSVELAAGAFEPVIRGRRVVVDGGLTQRSFHHIGFMLTSRQDGPFALTVHDIAIIDPQARHD